ncbi:hypothetical protein VSR34_35565 [Paraburkholderia sp. JHI2823]|uniref:hypothetical protein n=1 Tax=Paraburkholderia sp. JHI2823 TaxID=3112960 RepID=UPI00316F52E5
MISIDDETPKAQFGTLATENVTRGFAKARELAPDRAIGERLYAAFARMPKKKRVSKDIKLFLTVPMSA